MKVNTQATVDMFIYCVIKLIFVVHLMCYRVFIVLYFLTLLILKIIKYYILIFRRKHSIAEEVRRVKSENRESG